MPCLDRFLPGFAVQAHIGHGIEPLAGRGIQGAEVGQLQTGEEILFHIAHPIFHAAFFIALADIAWGNGKATVRGKIEILRIEHRRFPEYACEHGGFEVIDHNFFGNAAKEFKGVLVTREEVFHGLRDGELDIHHAAVAQHDDKEAQASTCLPHGHRAEGAPIDLGTLAGSKGQFEKSGLAFGSHRAHVGFDDGVTASKALLAQALKDLRSAIGVFVQHLDNLGLKRSEYTGPWR